MMANSIAEIVQVLANASTALGIPLAIYLFYEDRKREIREREYVAYDGLDSNYIEYLKLCLENPELDVFHIPIEDAKNGEGKQAEKDRKEMIMFAILFSILERSYLMYQHEHTGVKIRRRAEWEKYIINDWLPRENFRRMWKLHGEEYQVDFVRYMNSLVKRYDNERATGIN